MLQCTVTQICFDASSVRLSSWSLTSTLEIRITIPFVLVQANGSRSEIDPEISKQLAPVLSLLRETIVSLQIETSGALKVLIGNGGQVVLEVPLHPEYEAFEIKGTGEFSDVQYLAGPGNSF